MSYILDALRRAEDDRRNARSSPIEQITVTSPAAAQPSIGRRAALLAALGVGALVVAAAGYWVWQRSAPTSTTAAALPTLIPAGEMAPKAAATVTQNRAPSSPKSTRAAALTLANPIADAGRLASLDDVLPPAPPPAPPAPPVKHNVTAGTPAPATPAKPAVNTSPDADATLQTQPLTAPDTGAAPASTSTPAVANPAPAKAAATASLKAMPDSYRADFPQIDVQVHVYDSSAGKSWALIDGKRYRDGDTLPQGPKIYQIVPQGIVFDWQGQRVLYPVGS